MKSLFYRPDVLKSENQIRDDQIIEMIAANENVTFDNYVDRPYYPDDKQLCLLAKLAYKKDKNKIEEEMTNYHEEFMLDTNWVLLAIGEYRDGYFGAAFWHNENRHLVISHRGTKSWKACWADLRGVVKNYRTSQIHSALSFAFNVLEKFKPKKCSLSITGHSLGGWLAQLSTFALKYFEITNNGFVRRINEVFHPHAVTFDSPGCKEMLEELSKLASKKIFTNVSIESSEMISSLDIVTYCLRPNEINMFNTHVGTLITFIWVPEERPTCYSCCCTCCHMLQFHRLNKFINIFNSLQGNAENLQLATYWPCNTDRSILSNIFYLLQGGSEENRSWYQMSTRWENCTLSRLISNQVNNNNNSFEGICVPYPQNLDEASKFSRVFDNSEWEFVQNLHQCFVNMLDLSSINVRTSDCTPSNFFRDNVPKFDIENRKIKCNAENEKFVRLIKWTLTFHPEIKNKIAQILNRPKGYVEMYEKASEEYKKKFSDYSIKKEDSLSLIEFQDNGEYTVEKYVQENNQKIMVFITIKRYDEAFRIYSILNRITDNTVSSYTFLKWSDIETFKIKGIDPVAIFASKSVEIDKLLIIDLEGQENMSPLENFQDKMSADLRKKIICIASPEFNYEDQEEKTIIIDHCTRNWMLKDLIQTSRTSVLQMNIISIKGKKYSLQDLFAAEKEYIENNLTFDILKENFFNDNVIELFPMNDSLKHAFSNLFCLDINEIVELETLFKFLLMFKFKSKFKLGLKILMTGISQIQIERLCTFCNFENQIIFNSKTESEECLENFYDLCWNTEPEIIFWFHNIKKVGNTEVHDSETENTLENSHFQCRIFDNNFYRARKFKLIRTIVAPEAESEDKLIEKLITKESDERNEVILITGKPGTGKTASMLALAKNNLVKRSKGPKFWIIWVNVISAVDPLKSMTEINLDTVIRFLLQFCKNESNNFAFFLLKCCLKENKSIAVHLFFDSFDEILSYQNENKQKILDNFFGIISFLVQSTSAQVWITSRKTDSFNKFKITEVEIEEISLEEKGQFLKEFWSPGMQLYQHHDSESFLKGYIDELLQKLRNPLNCEKSEPLLGFPLQLRLIAELYQPNPNIQHTFSSNSEFNICELYEKCVDRKIRAYYETSNFLPASSQEVSNDTVIKSKERCLIQHGLLAVQHLFPKNSFFGLLIAHGAIKTSDINRIGLIEIHHNQKLIFSHETFAQYLSSVWFVYCMEKLTPDIPLKEFIYENIFRESDCKVMRYFIDNILARKANCLSCTELFSHWDYKFNTTGSSDLLLHLWTKEGNRIMVETLLKSWNPDDLKININLPDSSKQTALHIATELKNNDIASILLKYGADKYKVDKKNVSPWLIAFEMENWDLFFKMNENDRKFFEGVKGSWALRRSIQKGQMDIALKIIQNGGKINNCDDSQNQLQLLNSCENFDRWNLILTLMKLNEFIKSTFSDEIKNFCVNNAISTNGVGNSVISEFLMSCIKTRGKVAFILQLIEKADREDQVALIVQAKNKYDQTLLHFAVAEKSIDVARKLIENGANPNISDKNNIKPINLAIKSQHLEMITLLIEKGAT